MRVQKRSPWLNGLGVVLAAMALWGTQAQAGVSSDKPGSVVLWPKVIADGTRDTLISLTNTKNQQAYAHCEYVQALGICSTTGSFCSVPKADPRSPGACEPVPGNVCTQQWQSADFDVALTRQQPTIWRVSTGRVDNPFATPDGACDPIPAAPLTAPRQSCPGLFLIGQVPPVVQPFRGELTCFQVNVDGSDNGSNGLKGEATIETIVPPSEQISTYNSVNIEAIEGGGVDGLIRLNGIEYSACPPAVEVSHYSQGAQDLVAAGIDPTACTGTGCPVESEITLVPCRADYVREEAAAWATHIEYTDEFEVPLTIEIPLECWANFDLRDLGFAPSMSTGSQFQRTRLTPSGSGRCILGDVNAACRADADCGAGGVCGPVTGILAIVEEFHNTAASLAVPPTGPAGTAASNGYAVAFDGSLERAGRCRGNLTTRCTSNTQCPSGLCRFTAATCTHDADCGTPGDFCDRCMNDEITFEAGPIALPMP
ncbi:MAG TPA: hypothetical protein VL049_01520 [Candidatus Dormibacteraeota bacterium]|nr:hypothetical protein [Candidatus Dormibacteraeota bacterium]